MSLFLLQMFISGGGESDLYAVMARTGDKGVILKYCLFDFV